MTTLVSGTQPSVGGTAELTGVTTVTPVIEIPVVFELSTTGIFVLSATKPVLTTIEGFNLVSSIPAINISSQVQWFQLVADAANAPAVPVTRQLLIR